MGPPPAKKSRYTPLADELTKGAIVFYGDGEKRGVVRDAYAPIDEFWVADETTGEIVRGDDGDIVSFRARDLQLATAPPALRKISGGAGDSCSAARVLLIGGEAHMLEILQHFGMPDVTERTEPSQQLLAVPCPSCQCGPRCTSFEPWSREMCDAATCPLSQVAADAIEPGMWELARRLRPDIKVNLRPYHLKQAIEKIGPGLKKLDGLYCLSVVTLPYSHSDIAKTDGQERRWREEVRCQIDLGMSGDSAHEVEDSSAEDTARRALAETCGVSMSANLWTEATQSRLRQVLRVDLPLSFSDGPGAKVYVLLLPEKARSWNEDGLLCFDAFVPMASAASDTKTTSTTAGTTQDWTKMSIQDWAKSQDQFKDLPKLPAGWIRCRSKKNGDIYFWDTKNNKPQFDFPLPEGWTKQISKSTGKVYYFNAKKRKSVFEPPTEP
mmetsp:Transcript_35959/g.99062  ORF Transcript_35959/g.99062 Transcript_35959/m.99062 type:complete len:439 (-) Transcript_35959:56-1372(-)